MNKLIIPILLLIGINVFAQDNVPFKNEILFKAKGEKYDLFVTEKYYHLITENPVSGKVLLNKINKETGVIEGKSEIDYKFKNDSLRYLDGDGMVVYSKISEIKFPKNLKFRIEFEGSTYLENHLSIQRKKYNNLTESPNFFDGEMDGFVGVNSIFSDSIYSTSDIKIEIEKYDVVNFIYNEPNHYIVVNKVDKFIANNGNDLFNAVGGRVYCTDKNGKLIWEVLNHKEILDKKLRAELEAGGESLFEYMFYKDKLVLFYQLYITIYDLKTGRYEFVETKKGPHWRCYYKKLGDKIYEYSNKEIREIDLDKLIMIK